ncbi:MULTISPECIES: DEAD/DEAH box helicase [Brevibacillus]|jgi:DEAD/DEAH box helicase domain-containing protein|uniref:DEAD/DEAH box helicase n=1 Tax=Brevibacillus TaxID=55080 RepID=UPI00046B0614|nr:DEAD/DEAH box helicase [Brevibacillus borstelensis]MCM3469877.1 DEAD/DEAH box helicase [Brevibacillus borstelensis]MCM3560230.1 DEAD/DEAH box helicase [Brevibacillus borstelensis]MCM3590244.1 DEAD/DEAH box helicase [Brevibacillus borstelensis]MCM3623621.1 DEAD/DEAH box helicase [Brevibacillus borstelensis]MED1883850.1 DEAD/DEAH box helicase [Brevibacillus borstelensis]
MKIKMDLAKILENLKQDERFRANIEHWKVIPPREAATVPFPDDLDPRIRGALAGRGIPSLYTHQETSFRHAREGKHIVAVTPTASGKSMCYHLPVLQTLTENPEARALYLFPTKALAQDQKSELHELIDEMGLSIKSDTYDGDTPAQIRQTIRKAGNIVITNPDMLHSAILPHHTKWVSFFEHLKYIVIDELHTYRGVFGSHVANVIRRLKRICAFYGSSPQFICTSATIANPRELAEQLTEENVVLVDNNGAPAGKKHFIFYNPPVVNKQLNIRRSSTLEARDITELFLTNGIQTILFARSRVRVEILLKYLQELIKRKLGEKTIQGYRGGYLPSQRRAIEKGLRQGDIIGVVSTNALELGVDIGQLQVCVITGYPGSVASTWQQAGRAGRRQGESVVVLVGSSTPLDQYVIQHPEYFFERSPESARINPDNLIILVDHIKCAAYELPFSKGDRFGRAEIMEILEFLTEEQILHHAKGKWFWMNDSFPAHNISLRSASQENVVIIDISERGNERVIGEMDRFSSMTLLHDEAIYLHQGTQYQVEKLDYEEKKAYVREVQVDYYTDANLAVQLRVLEEDQTRRAAETEFAYGEVTVNAMATIFKKIKFETHENIGSGPIHLPEEELHTNAAWLSFSEQVLDVVGKSEVERGLVGLAHVLQHVAPLFVMCDRMDLHVIPQRKAIHSGAPTIFLYDRYPGGIGLSEQVYKEMDTILARAEELILSCPCESGCPSCVGAAEDGGKELALTLLRVAQGGSLHVS